MALQNLGLLLHQCSKTNAIRHGCSLHAVIVKMGLQSDVFLSNHVLNMYAKCGYTGHARRVFDNMAERNLVSWSAMISGYDQAGEPLMALNLFSQKQIPSNEYVYSSVISACSSMLALSQGKQVHAQLLKSGYESISFVSNSLLSMYMNCGLYVDAFSIFSTTPEPNAVSYNAMIAGFAENMQLERGLELFRVMHQKGVLPDRFTFLAVLGICASMEDLQLGVEFHCQAIKFGLHVTPFIGNVILTMYSKCNSIEEVEKAFRSIEEKDVISWNTLISACSHCADHAKALKAFGEMEGAVGVRPDDFTFASALAACAGLASIRYGGQIHCHLIRTTFDLDIGVGNALVNMYAKCGCINHASSIFEHMHHRNLVSWNTIIAGFANHGHGWKAVEMFEVMKAMGIKPDAVTFIGLLAACNHAGLVDKGRAYFNCMKEVYGITPELEHFSCMIDLLGRAGRLEEAEEYMKAFPSGGDLVIWGSLLSACRLYKDVMAGERVAAQLLELRPEASSPYVLLSNLYALDGKWDGVAEARKMLKGSGVKKEPGHSLIEVQGMVEKFTVGDFSHSKIGEMREVLGSLRWAGTELSV